jgi:RNA ligase
MKEILSIADIQQLVVAGCTDWSSYGAVAVRQAGDLLLFNYTPLAQYEGRWNFFERVSRGLILHRLTGEVVARPFDKFYNWLQGGRRASGHIVTVTEKVDGSIGILYRLNGHYHIATRGSFDSEQAAWATAFLQAHHDLSGLPNELTLLFEIIYPANRVVVDYGEREDLVLLAARNRLTGAFLPFFPQLYELAERYGFTLPQVFAFNDITQIIEQAGTLPASAEGYVVEFSDGTRFKFKGDRYLELHKLLTSLTFKNVLKAMEHNRLTDLLAPVPDEMLDKVREWVVLIETTVARVKNTIEAAFAAAPKTSRKEFALWVLQEHPTLQPYLFALFDERDVVPLIYQKYDWRTVHTEADRSEEL